MPSCASREATRANLERQSSPALQRSATHSETCLLEALTAGATGSGSQRKRSAGIVSLTTCISGMTVGTLLLAHAVNNGKKIRGKTSR